LHNSETLVGGNAEGGGLYQAPAGFYPPAGSLNVLACVFTDDQANAGLGGTSLSAGGALYLAGGPVLLGDLAVLGPNVYFAP
jgi:hypothetical protein